MYCICVIRPTRSVGIRFCLMPKPLEPASRCAIGTFNGSSKSGFTICRCWAPTEQPRWRDAWLQFNEEQQWFFWGSDLMISDEKIWKNVCSIRFQRSRISYARQGHETSHRCSSSTGRLVPTFSWMIWMVEQWPMPHPSCIRCCHGLMFSLGVPSQAFQWLWRLHGRPGHVGVWLGMAAWGGNESHGDFPNFRPYLPSVHHSPSHLIALGMQGDDQMWMMWCAATLPRSSWCAMMRSCTLGEVELIRLPGYKLAATPSRRCYVACRPLRHQISANKVPIWGAMADCSKLQKRWQLDAIGQEDARRHWTLIHNLSLTYCLRYVRRMS